VGLGIINLISSQPTGYTVYMTSRSGNDLPDAPSSSRSTYIHRKLDISDADSVRDLASEVSKQHPDGIDAIINNAGVNLNPDGYSASTIQRTMGINLHGTKAVRRWVYVLAPMLINLDVRLVHADGKSRWQDCKRRKRGGTLEWLFGGYKETHTRRYFIYIGRHGARDRVRGEYRLEDLEDLEDG
jgi:NAD(P)-dependent dehydrogenase (short-subunit alcohol dehydrogenase family)